MNKLLKEGARQNDLKFLVSDFISVDQYTAKMDDDNITVAFFCMEKVAGEELKDFINRIFVHQIQDVELSDTITKDDKWIVYVEFERNSIFPTLLMDVIKTIENLTSNEMKWKFKTFKDQTKELTIENLETSVRLTKLRDSISDSHTEEDKKEEFKESFEFPCFGKNRKILKEDVSNRIEDTIHHGGNWLDTLNSEHIALSNYLSSKGSITFLENYAVFNENASGKTFKLTFI